MQRLSFRLFFKFLTIVLTSRGSCVRLSSIYRVMALFQNLDSASMLQENFKICLSFDIHGWHAYHTIFKQEDHSGPVSLP